MLAYSRKRGEQKQNGGQKEIEDIKENLLGLKKCEEKLEGNIKNH